MSISIGKNNQAYIVAALYSAYIFIAQLSAVNKYKRSVQEILVHKQVEKVESIETGSLAQVVRSPSTVQRVHFNIE